jgi:hypothetical protein
MNAREELYAALMAGGPHSPERSGKASALIEAFAYQMAEKVRRIPMGAPEAQRIRDLCADAVHLGASCGTDCTCLCHLVDPSPCDDCIEP